MLYPDWNNCVLLSYDNRNVDYTFSSNGYLAIELDLYQCGCYLYLNGVPVGLEKLYENNGYNTGETNFIIVKKGDRLTSKTISLGSYCSYSYYMWFCPFRR